MGRECFLRSGLTRAVFQQDGNLDSVKQRLSKEVIGVRRLSRQDLRTTVGRKSSKHEALDDDRMAAFTSSVVAGLKQDRTGGCTGGVMCGETLVTDKDD